MSFWDTNPSWNSLKSINGGLKFTSVAEVSPSDFNNLVENMQFLYTNYLNSEGGELDMKRIYPVGSIYLSLEATFHPAEQFGGTWTKLTDRFLLGAGNNYNNGVTGGSEDAVIVEHDHFIFGRDGVEKDTDYVSGRCYVTAHVASGSAPYTLKRSANQTDQPLNGVTSKTGVSGVGKNMPPYLAVYMWKRTA